jgi:hypothetical protein
MELFAEHGALSTVQLAELLLIGERASRRLVVALASGSYLERVPYVDQRRPYRLGSAAFALGQQLHAAAVARSVDTRAVVPLDLGQCLNAYRRLRGLNLVSAAELFGWEPSYLGHVERGETAIDLWVIQQLAEAIDEDPLKILGARL